MCQAGQVNRTLHQQLGMYSTQGQGRACACAKLPLDLPHARSPWPIRPGQAVTLGASSLSPWVRPEGGSSPHVS
jgi:hypothetical protein